MAKLPLLTDDSLRILQHLLQKNIRFLVLGNSAALLQGAPVATVDIDLWFEKLSSEELRSALGEIHVSIVTGAGMAFMPPTLVGVGTDIFDVVLSPHGLEDFEKEWEERVLIDVDGLEVPVLPLKRVIASKRAAGREKDIVVLPQLEIALRVLEAKGRE